MAAAPKDLLDNSTDFTPLPYCGNCFVNQNNIEINGLLLFIQNLEADVEVIIHQITRRDKLSDLLRKNKKLLDQLEEEIYVLSGQRRCLDELLGIEIMKLRINCQILIEDIETVQKSFVTNSLCNSDNRKIYQIFQQPKSFESTSLPMHNLLKSPKVCYNYLALPYSETFVIPHHQIQHSSVLKTTCESCWSRNISDSSGQQIKHGACVFKTRENIGKQNGLREYTEVETWKCNLCTFLNNPQLNVCECCDNVRILPGTLKNISSTGFTKGSESNHDHSDLT